MATNKLRPLPHLATIPMSEIIPRLPLQLAMNEQCPTLLLGSDSHLPSSFSEQWIPEALRPLILQLQERVAPHAKDIVLKFGIDANARVGQTRYLTLEDVYLGKAAHGILGNTALAERQWIGPEGMRQLFGMLSQKADLTPVLTSKKQDFFASRISRSSSSALCL